MNWIKVNFFKITTILLLLVVIFLSYGISKSSGIENHISLPFFSYSDMKDYGWDYVTVKGTLSSVPEGEIANEINSVEFTCDNSIKTCNLVQADLFDDSMLTTYTESFSITSWDDNFIIFKTLPDNLKCVEWTYRIDRVKKELIGVRESSANYDYASCMGIGLDKFEIKVVDGWEVVSKLRGY